VTGEGKVGCLGRSWPTGEEEDLKAMKERKRWEWEGGYSVFKVSSASLSCVELCNPA
jgi:hypothetical protein